jgi:hypothetical protein
MPFVVVVPAGISPALQENIEEVGAGSSSAHAIFLYSRNEGPPVLTIIENSARESAPSANFGMTYSTTGHAPVLPPVPPRLAPGSGVAISRTNDRFFSVRVASTSWITHGTRITLISMPGAFTRAEIDEILKAMR